tara:strand:- start:359 stop:805 length:447 start_codon:yes stop_codon:yes gene_type:complete
MPVAIKATCEQYVDINGKDHFLDEMEKLVSGPISGSELYKGEFKGSVVNTTFGFFGLFRKQDLYGRFKQDVNFSHRPKHPIVIERGRCFKRAEDAVLDAQQHMTGDELAEELEPIKEINGLRFYVAITNQDERLDCIDIWQVSISQSV